MWLTLCVCMCVVMRVCTTLCFLTWILKKAGPVRQWTNCALRVCQSALIFLRTLVGRGRASNRVGGLTGEDEKEGTSDEAAASIPPLPPTFPSARPRHNPSTSFLHIFIIALLNEKGWSRWRGDWGVTILLHTPFVPWREECAKLPESREAEKVTEGGRGIQKGYALLDD